MQHACTLVAIARNEGKHILEWLAYNLSIGFERIIVYDNGSEDRTADVVAAAGLRDRRISVVPWPTVVEWPVEAWISPQCAAYTNAVSLATTPWIGFFDIDEFVVPFRDGTVSNFLQTMPDEVSAVHVNWRSFGSSGQTSEDYDLVTETFTRCAAAEWGNHQHYKTFARRERIRDVLIHYARIDGGRRVLTDFQDVAADNDGIAHAIAYNGIQLNHYQTKTWTEFERRMKAGDAFYPDGHPGKNRESSSAARFAALDRNEVEDLAIQPFLVGMKKQVASLTRVLAPEAEQPSKLIKRFKSLGGSRLIARARRPISRRNLLSRRTPAADVPESPGASVNPQIVNDVAKRGFIIGWDPLQLGGTLSCAASLFVLSRRTGLPSVYPHAKHYEALFEAPGKLSEVRLDRKVDRARLDRLLERLQSTLETHPHVAAIRGSSFEMLGRAKVHGVVWFSEYENHLADWKTGDAETALTSFCRRGNGLVVQGAYWRQFFDMRSLRDDGVALRAHLGPLRAATAGRLSEREATAGVYRVGVHCVLEAYKPWLNGTYSFSSEQYRSIIARLAQALGSRPHQILIFSEEKLPPDFLEGLQVDVCDSEPLNDFVRLSQCDMVVGPPSSVATWAAFLGQKQRIVLTKERIAGTEPILDMAVDIPFPTGAYVPGDPRGGPI